MFLIDPLTTIPSLSGRNDLSCSADLWLLVHAAVHHLSIPRELDSNRAATAFLNEAYLL